MFDRADPDVPMAGENEGENAPVVETHHFDEGAMDATIENVAVSGGNLGEVDAEDSSDRPADEVGAQRFEDILDSLLSSVPSEAAVVAAAAMMAAEDSANNEGNANDDRHSTGSDFYDEDDDVIADEHGDVSGVNDTVAEDHADHVGDHEDEDEEDDEGDGEEEEDDPQGGERGADDRSGTRRDRRKKFVKIR